MITEQSVYTIQEHYKRALLVSLYVPDAPIRYYDYSDKHLYIWIFGNGISIAVLDGAEKELLHHSTFSGTYHVIWK